MPISGINLYSTNRHCAFMGKWEDTEYGTPYYKTNSGTVAGGVLSIASALCWFSKLTESVASEKELKKHIENIMKNPKLIEEQNRKNRYIGINEPFEEVAKKSQESLKYQKKWALAFGLIATALTIGCGVLVDNVRNKKAAETADLTRVRGKHFVLKTNEHAELSQNQNTYFKSNLGSKYGALMGAGCGIVHSLMCNGKYTNLASIIRNGLVFALGGFIMGKIADSNTNKDAFKHA